MREILSFSVAGRPAPQPRPRATGAGPRPRIYTPPQADEWKHAVRARARLALLETGVEPGQLVAPGAPLHVEAAFRMPRPKAHWVGGRPGGRLRPGAPVLHACKPDVDNLLKAVLDALGKFQDAPPLLWVDDAQVVSAGAAKYFSQNPGLDLVVWGLPFSMDPSDLVDPRDLSPSEALEVERRRAGISRGELSGLLGVPAAVVRSWLSGELGRKNRPAPECRVSHLAPHEVCLVLRLRRGWTVRELAQECSLGYAWLAAVERGEVKDVEPLLAWWARRSS